MDGRLSESCNVSGRPYQREYHSRKLAGPDSHLAPTHHKRSLAVVVRGFYNDSMNRSLACLLLALPLAAQKPAPFEVEEATIAQVHDAMKAGRLTCGALVGM